MLKLESMVEGLKTYDTMLTVCKSAINTAATEFDEILYSDNTELTMETSEYRNRLFWINVVNDELGYTELEQFMTDEISDASELKMFTTMWVSDTYNSSFKILKVEPEDNKAGIYFNVKLSYEGKLHFDSDFVLVVNIN